MTFYIGLFMSLSINPGYLHNIAPFPKIAAEDPFVKGLSCIPFLGIWFSKQHLKCTIPIFQLQTQKLKDVKELTELVNDPNIVTCLNLQEKYTVLKNNIIRLCRLNLDYVYLDAVRDIATIVSGVAIAIFSMSLNPFSSSLAVFGVSFGLSLATASTIVLLSNLKSKISIIHQHYATIKQLQQSSLTPPPRV